MKDNSELILSKILHLLLLLFAFIPTLFIEKLLINHLLYIYRIYQFKTIYIFFALLNVMLCGAYLIYLIYRLFYIMQKPDLNSEDWIELFASFGLAIVLIIFVVFIGFFSIGNFAWIG